MKHSSMIIMICIMSCAAVSIIGIPIVGSYAYFSHNEEIVNQFNIKNTPTAALRLLATVSNATLPTATVSNATSSNWGDTDLDSDELEWKQGDNVELTNDLS